MRLVSALALIAVFWVSFGIVEPGPARVLAGPATHWEHAFPAETSVLQRAKIVCGDTPEGFRCRHEPGAIRRGKTPKMPGRQGGSTSGGTWSGSDSGDALPSAPADGASATGACPPNAERLGGHCIPYTQTCSRGLEAGAPPQICRSAAEKLVCDFRSDGLKDCCCRTYSQF